MNPDYGTRFITNLEVGSQQSTGQSNGGTRDYFSAEAKLVLHNTHVIGATYKKDHWGPYDFHRQFNITYPEQFKIGYSKYLDQGAYLENASKLGVEFLYRSHDENSPASESNNGNNDYVYDLVAHYTFAF